MKDPINLIAVVVGLVLLFLFTRGTSTTDPSPIPDKGLRVLIVWETSSQPTMPDTQRNILYATAPGSVRDWLVTKCVKVNDTPEFRIIDKDSTMERESKIWQSLFDVERKSYPWIIIANGTRGFSGPLPVTMDETLALLKKYEVSQ